MFDRILRRMRELVRTSRYVMTVHGQEEMEADGLTIFDVEHCLLTGRIVERQKDYGTAEWKYIVEGKAIEGDRVAVAVKIGPTTKVIILTAYLL